MARKNGILTQLNDLWLKTAPGTNKRDVGQRVNELKTKVGPTVDATLARVLSGALFKGRFVGRAKVRDSAFQYHDDSENLDITLPGIRRPIGAEHPVIRTMNEIVGVFRNLGYSVEEGPEIETDYSNFKPLNFPPNHPAR